jgi:hypothetical protein
MDHTFFLKDLNLLVKKHEHMLVYLKIRRYMFEIYKCGNMKFYFGERNPFKKFFGKSKFFSFSSVEVFIFLGFHICDCGIHLNYH